ncbi:MAG: hypothetical protein U0V73_11900 [Acidimicrobiia bacterium]
MATTTKKSSSDAPARLIDSIEDVEHSTLEAVRKFVDTVNGSFPDVGEDGPRRRIIDSAFTMVEQLVGASNQLARRVVAEAGIALENAEDERKPAAKAR